MLQCLLVPRGFKKLSVWQQKRHPSYRSLRQQLWFLLGRWSSMFTTQLRIFLPFLVPGIDSYSLKHLNTVLFLRYIWKLGLDSVMKHLNRKMNSVHFHPLSDGNVFYKKLFDLMGRKCHRYHKLKRAWSVMWTWIWACSGTETLISFVKEWIIFLIFLLYVIMFLFAMWLQLYPTAGLNLSSNCLVKTYVSVG